MCYSNVYQCMSNHLQVSIHVCQSPSDKYHGIYVTAYRPTQSMIYVHERVNRFQKSILLIVHYKYLKSCSENLILQNLILRTRLYGTGFITQPSWLFHLHPTKMVGWKYFVPHNCISYMYECMLNVLQVSVHMCQKSINILHVS